MMGWEKRDLVRGNPVQQEENTVIGSRHDEAPVLPGDAKNGQAADHRDPTTTPLRACLLLAGGLRASPLAEATGISPLDLHLMPGRTVLEAWLERCSALHQDASSPLEVRVIYGDATPAPHAPERVPANVRFRTERDTRQYRGPAGIARDAAGEYDDDAAILIAEAARFIAVDLIGAVVQHRARAADITVLCNRDSSPAGIFLAKRSTLDLVPRTGFTDLKEQWLTRAVTSGLHVRVHRLAGNQSHELRTPSQFLAAARAARLLSAGALADGHEPTCVPPQIAAGAVVVDSVIMPGAVVAERSVVVRSIVCAGARVESGATIIDQVVRQSPRSSRRLAGRHAGRGSP
jgi:hypothetical protein